MNEKIVINVRESRLSYKLLNLFFALVTVLVLVFDQVTKYIVRTTPAESFPIKIIQGFIYISRVLNSGAAFGIFQSRTNILIIISIIAIILIIVLKIKLNIRSLLYHIALGMILGGAVGNLIDRITAGEVIDFIHVEYFSVFNVADSFIVIGFGIIILTIIRCFFVKNKPQKIE